MIKFKSIDKSKVVRNLGKKYKLVPYVEKALVGFEDEWKFKCQEKLKDHAWHPSSHCTEPVTVLYAFATEPIEPKPNNATSTKNFQVGHFWHQLLQHIVLHKLEMCKPDAIERVGMKSWGDKEKGRVIITKAGLSAGDWKPESYHYVRGSGDIAPLETPDWKGLVDFKTMASGQFAPNYVPPQYAAKYECQMNIYMDLFDEEQMILFAINKDNGEFKEFLYERNQVLIDAIYDKWKFVSAAIDAGEEPTKMDDEMFKLPELTGPVNL
jgi:hypothetical protein